jgi:hypothetical protein
MKGLPVWMLAALGALSVLLLYLGYEERHEVGPGPLIIGTLWALFTLGAIGGALRGALGPDAEH